MQFLHQAVLPYAWAQFPISQIAVMRFTFYGFQNTLENCLMEHMQQTQSSMHTHYQLQGDNINQHAKVSPSASADDPLQTQGTSEDEDPIDT